MSESAACRPRVLFVTGRLAEPALRRVLAECASRVGMEPVITVLPISVAALMTSNWIAAHLGPTNADRVIVPGGVNGDVEPIANKLGVPVEKGPVDLRDLPEHFGHKSPASKLGPYDIEIIAEINHAPKLSIAELLEVANRFRADGADVIDLGCIPGDRWSNVSDAVSALTDAGHRVSIDSFDTDEVTAAVDAGAELVLSVNSSNREAAADWGCEVVAIPDEPTTLSGLDETLNFLAKSNVKFLIDPIVEPIGCGFTASLGRYLDVRHRYPQAEMFMGVGNLTEMSDVDSAGVNLLLAGFCQELEIRSVLTTEVANWCRSSIRELNQARRLVHSAVAERIPPKRMSDELLQLRDAKVRPLGENRLFEIAAAITDPNIRIFAERGQVFIMNRRGIRAGADSAELMTMLLELDPTIDVSHAYYLGYEIAKALIALQLGKQYIQDVELRWGTAVPRLSNLKLHANLVNSRGE